MRELCLTKSLGFLSLTDGREVVFAVTNEGPVYWDTQTGEPDTEESPDEVPGQAAAALPTDIPGGIRVPQVK
jgi:hypothetical protein